MGLLILALVIGIPLGELFLLIEIGGEIGGAPTILLCIATAAGGFSMIKRQGFDLAHRIQAKAQAGEPVGPDMISGFMLAVAGLCLFIPGFFTDFLGALLLIPPLRAIIGHYMVLRANIFAATINSASINPGNHNHTEPNNSNNGPVIDGEAEIIPPENGSKTAANKQQHHISHDN